MSGRIPPELMANTWSERERAIYDIGHQEGESCNSADWYIELCDVLPESVSADSPQAVAEYIRSLAAAAAPAVDEPTPQPEPFKVGELVTEAMGEPPVWSVVMRGSNIGGIAWQLWPDGSWRSIAGTDARTWAEVRDGARLIHLGGS